MAKGVKKSDFIATVGRRKRSTARVRLFAGKGQTMVNGLPVGDYFKDVPAFYFFKPFDLTDTVGKYYATVKVEGGGKVGQLGAFVHGLARALSLSAVEKFRKPLKAGGLLTRDPREKERRKPGLAQAARKKKQSPKR